MEEAESNRQFALMNDTGDKTSPSKNSGKQIRFADTTKASGTTSIMKRGNTMISEKRTKAILSDEHEQT